LPGRIDLHTEVPALPYAELRSKDNCPSSAEIRERVIRARSIQQERGSYNADIPVRQLQKLCELDEAG
jgi:magnesium chelatase family protein